MKPFCILLASCVLASVGALRAETTVGRPARINELVLPGTELEVKPLDDRRVPIVLRIVRVSPHGTAFRYDLEYYGLEPGAFDLKDHLRRKDRSSALDLPAIPVTIRSVLPPGQPRPHELEFKRTPWLGGYRTLLIIGAVVWVVGLVALLLLGRRKHAASRIAARPVTLADHLRPLIEGARAAMVTDHDQDSWQPVSNTIANSKVASRRIVAARLAIRRQFQLLVGPCSTRLGGPSQFALFHETSRAFSRANASPGPALSGRAQQP